MAESKNTTETPATPAAATTERMVGDLGVPMLPGKPDEPQGPEDALGEGPKRGNYADRIGPSSYAPHEVTRDSDGKLVVTAQRPRVADVGDADGKGGVTTASASS
jgi:hypothetical protein